MNHTNYKGKILVANLSIYGDPFFSKTVILLIEDEEGFVTGVVLNEPAQAKMGELIEKSYSLRETTVYLGGPVSEEEMYFLHSKKDFGGIAVTSKLFLSSDIDSALIDFTHTDSIDGNVRFFMGYCGWTKEQLEDEVKKGYWLIIDTFDENILQKTPSELWKELIISFNNMYSIWANAPIDPSMN
ncbi:YqgE/AlgH family protein [Capnocytophaga sp. ARDL2]|uniref:YqgE/AlgH family protein n=1 Tax=Capnocytophaga sp. ARDL2 TaxID=3238809 RepID=UPI003558DBBF